MMLNLRKYFQPKALIFSIGCLITAGFLYLTSYYYINRHNPEKVRTSPLISRIQEMHEKTIDWRLMDRGWLGVNSRVAILAIDEESIDLEGRWPWPRQKMAKLIEKALGYGAKVISFDMIFSEEEINSTAAPLEQFKKIIKNDPNINQSLLNKVEKEISINDSDEEFARVIKKHANQLVLGSYFDGDNFQTSPHVDLCLDAYFARTHEGQYWSRDHSPLIIQYPQMEQVNFPQEKFNQHLLNYFILLENSSSQKFFEDYPVLISSLKKNLSEYKNLIPELFFPGLSLLAVNNDTSTAKDLLSEVAPALATKKSIHQVFQKTLGTFSKKELVRFKKRIREEAMNYCHRFLGTEDELFHKDNFFSLWGDSEESNEQFESLSLKNFWTNNVFTESEVQKSIDESFKKYFTDLVSGLSINEVPQIYDWEVNIPKFSNVTRHTGFFNAIQETDGSIRRTRLVTRHGNSYALSLALKTFLVANDFRAQLEIQSEKKSVSKIKSLKILNSSGVEKLQIPVDSRGRLIINYSGPQYFFPYVSATQVLEDSKDMTLTWRKFDPLTKKFKDDVDLLVDKNKFLKDKVLILGASAVGVYDLRVTPFDENYPGVETHASVLSNLFTEFDRQVLKKEAYNVPGFLSEHLSEEQILFPLLLVTGISLTAFLTFFSPIAGMIATLSILMSIYLIDKFLIFQNGYVSPLIFQVSIVVSIYITLTFIKYFTEEQKMRSLKGTFEKYVSPSIVNEILSNPGAVELGGKKMNLTIFFSDIRSFTSISESITPKELSDLLNQYLTPMTNLIFDNKGTLDKYMGDAIMAFWGAPIPSDNHAKLACHCSLQMLKELEKLNINLKDRGLPVIKIGIGLNTGEVNAGNMGSNIVRSYTVMGDNVNLASRLEGLNKEYKTKIIISEYTYEEVKDEFLCRMIDLVKVKGRDRAVKIYELIAPLSEQSKLCDMEEFDEGLRLYYSMQFDLALPFFEKASEKNPGDLLPKVYAIRCNEFIYWPPEDGWDGVYEYKHK